MADELNVALPEGELLDGIEVIEGAGDSEGAAQAEDNRNILAALPGGGKGFKLNANPARAPRGGGGPRRAKKAAKKGTKATKKGVKAAKKTPRKVARPAPKRIPAAVKASAAAKKAAKKAASKKARKA